MALVKRGWGRTWLLLMLTLLAAGQAGAQWDSASSAPLYFRQYAVRESRLLEFTKDGQYRLLERRHDRVDEVDRGAWDEVSTGQLRLVSWRFKPAINSPPFKLGWITTETLSELRHLDSALGDLLGTMQNPMVSGKEAQQYLNTALYTTKVKPDMDYARVYADDAAPLKREEVAAFKTKVAEVMTSAVPMSVWVKRREQRGVAYLEIPAVTDRPWVGLQRAPANDAVALEAITTAPAAARIRGLFVEITREEFAQEATSHQEYLFVPKFSPDAGSSGTERVVSRDPAVDPVGAIQSFVPSLEVLSTSTTEEVAGYYANPGPTLGRGLSGSKLYLFPDRTYFFLRWADIMPGLIESRGTWDVVGNYVLLTDDGTVHRKSRLTSDFAYLPVRYSEKESTVTGLLGFPDSYERLMDEDAMDSRRLLFRTMERSKDIPVEGAAELKAELMRKHWRPDYAAGKTGATPPEW